MTKTQKQNITYLMGKACGRVLIILVGIALFILVFSYTYITIQIFKSLGGN